MRERRKALIVPVRVMMVGMIFGMLGGMFRFGRK
jgi:hypothetical protein